MPTDLATDVEPSMEADIESEVGLQKKEKPSAGTSQPARIKTKRIEDGNNDMDTNTHEEGYQPAGIKSEPIEDGNNDMDTDKDEEALRAAKQKSFTIFVANLPKAITRTQVKALFIQYGTITHIRIRSNNGRKILFKKHLQYVLSLNAYVQFTCQEDMEKALEMNGQMVGDNRIRVCPQDKKQIGGVKSTVFVGNIKWGTTENDLYDFFSQAGPIDFIRFIATKYIAYVCFKEGVSIKKVLKLDQEMLNNRPLRIQLVDTERTNIKLNKKGNVVKRNKFPSNGQQKNADDDFHGKVSEAKKKNKMTRSNFGIGSAKQKKIFANKLRDAFNKR
ncbi:uncharacterized protein LOC128709733 [Anopheles marshallii]|uniref:uncharacterized protein LOC128709733 n=1 Tax=Anopheles marshallii TaxID=1521116 RepID=UPI00237B59C2|nr:uncharacterized protein LOC128709733 [Anopheles marshallii]